MKGKHLIPISFELGFGGMALVEGRRLGIKLIIIH